MASSHRLDIISNHMWQLRYTKYFPPWPLKKGCLTLRQLLPSSFPSGRLWMLLYIFVDLYVVLLDQPKKDNLRLCPLQNFELSQLQNSFLAHKKIGTYSYFFILCLNNDSRLH